MEYIILGGGLAGLSLAHFLNKRTLVLEKENVLGGLCRSFELNGIYYDIGPHILFSKNKDMLNELTLLTETNKIKRSNKIFHKDRFVKYPFENDLAALDDTDRDYCVKEFLNNPHENSTPQNMLQFFLKTFGEGITRLYLEPYNEKIWKFDPSFMDMQMVERIPKPPKEDIIKSSKGIQTEGYLHQLYFYYPKSNGIQSLISGYRERIKDKAKVMTSTKITSISKKKDKWVVETDKGSFKGDALINCMPIHELFRFLDAPKDVMASLGDLKYNSIYIVALQAKKDNIGDNFAVTFADKNMIFHRLSKLNFLGENYCGEDNVSTLLIEITYRQDSPLASLSKKEIREKVITDLEKNGLVSRNDITSVDIKSFRYAYVIYDLGHRNNIDKALDYVLNMGIYSCGRFAEFEYLNMDKIIEHSYDLARKLNGEDNG
ncbi:MAG: FAD-dependent oxidoreductase [Candidatus Omnitrophota bacterium]